MSNQKRRAKGAPTGGQFAPDANAEAGGTDMLAIGSEPSEPDQVRQPTKEQSMEARYIVRASAAILRTEITDDQVTEDWANGPVTMSELLDLVEREWDGTDLEWVEPNEELHVTIDGDRVRLELEVAAP